MTCTKKHPAFFCGEPVFPSRSSIPHIFCISFNINGQAKTERLGVRLEFLVDIFLAIKLQIHVETNSGIVHGTRKLLFVLEQLCGVREFTPVVSRTKAKLTDFKRSFRLNLESKWRDVELGGFYNKVMTAMLEGIKFCVISSMI